MNTQGQSDPKGKIRAMIGVGASNHAPPEFPENFKLTALLPATSTPN
ncbi:MAG: hypothetical protein IPO07_15835 [Haliscomenobacter sp.]|nr:hypothetical protein [Haliscomenobacter sp.]MBK9490072.1 hypothetical protein [Haliscomenobacter sp.]